MGKVPRVLAKLLGYRVADVPQDGQNVHVTIQAARFVSQSNGRVDGPPPYQLAVNYAISVPSLPSGTQYTYDVAILWVHPDGSGPGIYGWASESAVAGYTGTTQVATGFQFPDPYGTQFLVQLKVKNVLESGPSQPYPDQVTTQQVSASIQGGQQAAPSQPSPQPTYQPPPQQYQPPPNYYQPPPQTYQPPPTPPQTQTPPQPAQPPQQAGYRWPLLRFFLGWAP